MGMTCNIPRQYSLNHWLCDRGMYDSALGWVFKIDTSNNVTISGNASSATKLQTPRTIWGRSFDGSGNVSGNITGSYFHIEDRASDPYFKLVDSDGQIGYVQLLPQNAGIAIGSTSALSLTVNPLGNVLIGTTTDNGYKLDVNGTGHYSGDLVVDGEVVAVAGEGTPAGVTDYSALTGKPQINGVTLLSGGNTLASLGIQAAGDYATNSGVTTLLANYADKTFVSNNYAGKAAFNSHTADTNIHITSAERKAWNAKWTYNEATIKAVKVTSASSADSVAWTGISGKPTTFTPSAHTHTASDVSGLPTSLKNPYALTFGSKTYDGSASATITASDLGALTSITKSMVEGVLTGDITSHTHSYIPLSGKGLSNGKIPYYVNFPSYSQLVALGYNEESTKNDDEYYLKGLCKWAIDNYANQGYLLLIGMAQPNSIGYCHIQLYSSNGKDTNTGLPRYCAGMYCSLAKRTVNFGCYEYKWYWKSFFLGNAETASKWATPRTITITGSVTGSVSLDGSANVSLATTTNHTHDFSSLTSKPTTIAGYGITDALTTSNFNSYTPTLTGTGASGTWGINISGNAASATKLQTPRTIWGRSFDGSADVNGGITIRRTWSTSLYNEGIRVVGTSNEWCGVFLGTADTTSGYQDSQWNILKTNIDTLRISRGTSNVSFFEIKPNGNVLIGTTTDNGYKLQVGGSERVYGDLIVDGEVSALVA